MAGVREEFDIVLEAASKVDDSVKKRRRDYKFKSFEGDELIEKIVQFGEETAEEYIKKGASSEDDIPPEITALLKFTTKIRDMYNQTHGGPSGGMGSFGASGLGGEGSPVLECKPPLSPGDITFDDIAGQKQIKEDIRQNYIYPFTLPGLFPTKSKGIMFYGPPGTGKTLLARAATAEIPGAAFFSPTPGDLKGKFVGETEKNIQMLFQCASNIIGTPIRGGSKHGVEKYRVSVIFIDEFDSIAGARGDDPHMRNSVNALLQAMDGIQSSPNVSVIAATNLPWDIDDAVLRRFSAKIFVDLPDVTAREWLIRDAIAKNFLSPEEKEQKLLGNRISPPWVMRKAFDKDENQFFEEVNDSIFENIEKYGKSLCLVTTEKEVAVAGGFATLYRTGKEIVKEQKSSDVGPDFINDITDDRTEKNPDRLGISPKALDLVTRIVNGEKIDYDADDITNANREYFFGYSGSDISKIMDIAIQIASSRALTTSFFPKKITTPGGSVIYYIASTPDDAKAKYVVTEDTKIMLDATTGRKFELLKGEDLLRAVNYSLCEQDILSGIEKYPSTIKTKTYVDLLIYKYQGIPPEK